MVEVDVEVVVEIKVEVVTTCLMVVEEVVEVVEVLLLLFIIKSSLPPSGFLSITSPITEPPISQLRITAATMRILINMLKSMSLEAILRL